MRRFALLVLSTFLLVGCRFYEVDKGVYRGPQPDAATLEEAIKSYGLKTIINLRGESTASWYKQEKEVADRYGVKMINISMSAKSIPHRDNLIKLLDAFRDAQKPFYIHCMAGVDRTGEASALYQMIYMGKPLEDALEMLSPKFGHFENLMPAKRYFVRDVWKGEQWAYDEYNPCSGQFKYYDVNSGACQGKEVPLEDGDDT